jgi:hypothetical protein
MYVEIIEFYDSPNLCSSYRSLNLTTCLMYVEIIDLDGTASPKFSNSINLNLKLLCVTVDVRHYETELSNVR